MRVLVAAGVVSAFAPAHSTELKVDEVIFNSDSWELHYLETTGKICSLRGAGFIFHTKIDVSSDIVTVSFIREGWFDRSYYAPVGLRVDGGKEWKFAKVPHVDNPDKDFILLVLPKDAQTQKFITSLGKGKSLWVVDAYAGGEFTLDGSGKAIAALRDCEKQRLQ